MNRICKNSTWAALLILVTLCLTACGDSNPLIGKWEGKSTVASMNQSFTIEFTSKEMIVRHGQTSIGSRSMNFGGSAEVREPVYYRMEGGKVLISKDNTRWETVDMPDKNTIRFDMGIAVVTLKRQ